MKKKLLCLVMSLTLVLQLFAVTSVSAEGTSADAKIKNIIFMIPDGGGMTAFNMADAVKNAGGFNAGLYPYATPVEQGDMYIKDYWVGAETTHSANSSVTDSAAAGTALASGVKTNNGYIGVTTKGVPVANILEASQYAGKNTGIVVTYEWTNATPATFSAHDISRSNMTTMSEQIVNQGIDVVLGGTHSAFSSTSWFTDAALEEKGYNIMNSNTELATVKAGDKLWGKFSGNLYYDASSSRTSDIPTLAEMTDAAITALNDDNENGFFLMVEGSAVDGGGHANSARYMVGEYMAFDAACKVAIDFAKESGDTIVLIAPDHDTGGMYWDDANLSSIVTEIQAGNQTPTGLNWTGTSHTNWHGGIFIYAPEGVSYPDGIDPEKADTALSEFAATGYKTATTNLIDNTDIPKYLAGFIGVDLDELSEKLFVDVTAMGTYDTSTEVFSFSSFDVQIKRNESVAVRDGQEVDLNGEVALYINNKFYVPASLLSDLASGAVGALIDVSDKGTYDSTTETFTFSDYNAYAKHGSNILVFDGKKINMGNDFTIYSDGRFLVPPKALEALERFSSGTIAAMEIVADYNTKQVDVSGWIGATSKHIGVLAVVDGTEVSNDSLNSSNVLWVEQLTADYNGDYTFTFSAGEEDIANTYTFYINYTDSSSSTPVSRDFSFQNTIPAILVENADGGEIMYMDQLNTGDTVNVTLRGFDLEDSFQGSLIIAQYDEDNVLKDADVFTANGGSVQVGTEIKESAVVLEGTKTIKIMYWNKLSLAPVFGALTIPSKE